ncbi:uncharacterized protein LOC131674265 isoform X14 [Phymastichus coffea]|uniref:uncharacterized protein LOC131674265 isoform X14 n=1 Tax=Phymastichus coffea TaxID=108790 RepID=UPI00273C0A96|nr:uncharacterized protein LOC131674265 isoform X14 [Phymastichus coffea]
MKFKISQQQGANSHSKAVTCVTWISSDEIYSCGDDHSLMCWKFEDGAINSRVVAELPEDFYPTDMQWQPRPAQASGVGAVKKQSLDVLLISTADGKFHLVSRAGRVEKSVQAHTGATLSGKWSQDGSALMTGKPIGGRRIARTGTNDNAWVDARSRRGRADKGLVAQRHAAFHRGPRQPRGVRVRLEPRRLVHPLLPGVVTARAVAHGERQAYQVGSSRRPRARRRLESIPRSHRVRRRRLPLQGEPRSRGNDARPISVDLRAPQVWDANGAILYASGPGDQPITALSWCSSGSYFAVGSFNAVKLCDRSGWPHSTEKLQVGSVYDVAWSSDGTQAALACSSGSVPIAHVIERRLAYGGYEATLIKRKAVLVSEVGSDVRETLDIAERVVQLAFGFDHLVAVTPSQCHVYSVKNWNTPAIVDLKGGSVSAVLLADKHFLLLEWNAMSLFNYQGRSLGAPRWKNMTAEPLYPPCVSVCCDTIVARDQTNRRLVHVLEVSPKKPLAEAQPYAHAQDVTSLGLNYVGGLGDRQLALVDANRDLFLVPVRSAGFGRACRIGRCRPRVAGQLRRTDPLEPPPPLQRRWRRASPGRATPTCWPACSTPLCPSGCAPAACTAATASSRAGRASTRTAGDTRAVARRPRPDRLSLSLVFFSQRVRQAARDREREQRPRDRSPGRRRPGRLLVLRLRRYSAPAHPQRTVGRGGLGLPHSPERHPVDLPGGDGHRRQAAEHRGGGMRGRRSLRQGRLHPLYQRNAERDGTPGGNGAAGRRPARRRGHPAAERHDRRGHQDEPPDVQLEPRARARAQAQEAAGRGAGREEALPRDTREEGSESELPRGLRQHRQGAGRQEGGAREGEGEGARGSGAQAARVQGRREEQRRRGEIDDPGEGLNRCGRFCSSASFVQSAVLSIFIR